MSSIETIAGVIQVAVAPVFLLAGIAGLLGVLSTRLGRIIDRARIIERRIPLAPSEEQQTLLRAEASAVSTFRRGIRAKAWRSRSTAARETLRLARELQPLRRCFGQIP